jgi:DNA invertase Pin-like site-specific DNA recombinase
MSTDAAYIRTSTKDQHGEAQRHVLSVMMQARGIDLEKVRWFVDIGHSGAKEQRPHLDEMLEAVHRGEVRRLFIFKLDRLARSLRHLLTLVETFKVAGCALVSADGLDLGTPAGIMQMHVMGAIAQFERSGIVERVQSGVDRAKAKVPMGRPHAVTPKQVEAARRFRERGHSWRWIAKGLGVSLGALHRACNRPDDVKHVAPGKWRHDLLNPNCRCPSCRHSREVAS